MKTKLFFASFFFFTSSLPGQAETFHLKSNSYSAYDLHFRGASVRQRCMNIIVMFYTSPKQPTDTLMPFLQAMNMAYYHGKPVDSLLAHLPAGVVAMKIRGWHNLRRADVLYVKYPGNIFVAIHVDKFEHMNPNGASNNPPDLHWDITLFKKEKISYVVAFNGTQCINGCEYQFK